jgi:hypothetical protein
VPRIALVALLIAAPAVAAAQSDSDVPVARFALTLGGRGHLGEFGDRFPRGWLWGMEAGWQPTRLGIAWSIAWSVPRWTAPAVGGSFEDDDPDVVDEHVKVTEMNLGPRLRWPLSEQTPRFLLGSAGVTLLRTTIPVPPDSTRDYVGPYAGLGFEQLLAGRYMVAIEARYGMIVGGPAGVTVAVSLGFGSR